MGNMQELLEKVTDEDQMWLGEDWYVEDMLTETEAEIRNRERKGIAWEKGLNIMPFSQFLDALTNGDGKRNFSKTLIFYDPLSSFEKASLNGSDLTRAIEERGEEVCSDELDEMRRYLSNPNWTESLAKNPVILDDSVLIGLSMNGFSLNGLKARNIELQKVGLEGANLEGAKLYGAKFGGHLVNTTNQKEKDYFDNSKVSTLAGANLEGADLTDSDLSFVNVSDARLYDAQMPGATLDFASLRRANLGKVVFVEVEELEDGSEILNAASVYKTDFSQATLVEHDGFHRVKHLKEVASLKDTKFGCQTIAGLYHGLKDTFSEAIALPEYPTSM